MSPPPGPFRSRTPAARQAWAPRGWALAASSRHDLIQAGTQDVASGTGQSEYQAWIELLPQASRQVTLAVRPGDSVTVSIQEQGQGTGNWQISFTNNTSGQSYQSTVHYASSESSVEWVEEAPLGQNGLLPLDNFSSVVFSQASATVNGQSKNLSQLGAQPITMLNGSGQPLAVPSAISSDGGSFSIDRTSASSTPAPSTSPPGRATPPAARPPTSRPSWSCASATRGDPFAPSAEAASIRGSTSKGSPSSGVASRRSVSAQETSKPAARPSP